MNKIINIGVVSKDKIKTHRVEVLVEFEEAVTAREAEQTVADAISRFFFLSGDTHE